MRLIVKMIIIASLCVVSLIFFPWYVIMVIPFVMNLLIKTNGVGSFLSGFVSVSLIWLIYAIIIHNSTDGILTSKIALILPLGGSSGVLMVVTAIVGGLAAAMAGYTGNAFRNIIIPPDKKNKNRYGRPDYRYRS